MSRTAAPRDLAATLRRYSLAAGRVARANVSSLDRPLKVNVALTYWCQYRCKTCNIWQRKPKDELTTQEWLAFIERTACFSWADLTGGEIFLRDDIGEIADAVARTWRDLVVLHYPTNGFLTRKIADTTAQLARRRIPRLIVTVSLDGDETTNDDLRGIKGGFERQMETFAALHRMHGVQAVLGMTLSQFNVGQVERTFEACQRRYPALTWADFHVNLAQVSSHYYANAEMHDALAPRDVAMRELRRYHDRRPPGLSMSAFIERRFAANLTRYLDSGITPMRCHALRSSCFIDPWGTVYPCISYTRPVGRLRDTAMTLDPIWGAPATRAVQRDIWSGDCPHCWTACEAYQSILGNLVRPFDGGPQPTHPEWHRTPVSGDRPIRYPADGGER